MKEYSKSDYPDLDYLYDDILDNDIGYTEEFIYDGKKYRATVVHDGTYMEYGAKGSKVVFEEITAV